MTLVSLRNPTNPAGIYAHVPFCRHLCPYCDFAVAVRREPPFEAYASALLREWSARRGDVEGRTVRTLYLGGGTPALLPTDEFRRVVDRIRTDIDGELVEVTVEANPHDIDARKLDAWAGAGVTRISLGVQSFDDGYLKRLGRDHDGLVSRSAAEEMIAHGEFRTSIDLIYGGPGHDRETLEGDLDAVAILGPDHVSAYELTVEQNTVFHRRRRAGDLELPGDVDELGARLVERLATLGYERYEVSSFGRAGDRSAHNAGYWHGSEYLGIGMGAHSLAIGETIERRANVRSLKEYVADPVEGHETEALTAVEHFGERLFLAARTREVQSWSDLRSRFEEVVDDDTFARVDDVMGELRRDELWERAPTFAPTLRGLDFADWIGGRFWDVVTS